MNQSVERGEDQQRIARGVRLPDWLGRLLITPLYRWIFPSRIKSSLLPCAGCGFDLSATPQRLPCPECCTPINRSRLPLCYVPRSSLRTFRIGYALLLFGLAFDILHVAIWGIFNTNPLWGAFNRSMMLMLSWAYALAPVALSLGTYLCLRRMLIASSYAPPDYWAWPRAILRAAIVVSMLYSALWMVISGCVQLELPHAVHWRDWMHSWTRVIHLVLPIDVFTIMRSITLIAAFGAVYIFARRMGRTHLASAAIRIVCLFTVSWVIFQYTQYSITNARFPTLVKHARIYSSIGLLASWIGIMTIAIWILRDCLRWRTLLPK